MTHDDVKYLADTIMIENGFSPAQMPYGINFDTLVLGYVCGKCNRPAAIMVLSGIELLNRQGIVDLVKARCNAKIEEHKC